MAEILTTIAYHNGAQYIDGWPPLDFPTVVIDTGSDINDLETMAATGVTYLSLYSGGCTEAYKLAFLTWPSFDGYFFMHDSMKVKEPRFLESFQHRGDVVAWIGFQFDTGAPGTPERAWMDFYYPERFPRPQTAIFGPIFYASRRAMLLALPFWPPPLKNRHDLCAAERGLAVAFKMAGFDVTYLEEYSNERIDQTRDYRLFDKFRPNRE